jgi:hypothetical protein
MTGQVYRADNDSVFASYNGPVPFYQYGNSKLDPSGSDGPELIAGDPKKQGGGAGGSGDLSETNPTDPNGPQPVFPKSDIGEPFEENNDLKQIAIDIAWDNPTNGDNWSCTDVWQEVLDAWDIPTSPIKQGGGGPNNVHRYLTQQTNNGAVELTKGRKRVRVTRITDPVEAQNLANSAERGVDIVFTTRPATTTKMGHFQIVVPDFDLSEESIRTLGPRVVQGGFQQVALTPGQYTMATHTVNQSYSAFPGRPPAFWHVEVITND